MDYSPLVASAAQRYGVPVDLALRLVNAESSGNPSAVSPKGAVGLTQLMPGTAQDMGVTNPLDPAQNINGGMKYLGGLISKYGDVPTALVAYNWGPGHVDRLGASAAPASTQAYVNKVTGMQDQDPFLKMLGGASSQAPQADQSDPFIQMLSGAGKASAAPAQAPASNWVGNMVSGAVKGATDIGSTLMDLANRKLGQPVISVVPQNMRPDIAPVASKAEITQGVDQSLSDFGADPNSLAFKGGRLGAQIAGTAGIGGAMAAPLKAAGGPITSAIANGLETGGFRVGGLSGVPGLLARAGTGAAVGGASAGLVDPNQATTGALIGGGLPLAAQAAGYAGNAIRNAVTAGGASPEVRQLAQRADQLGIQIPADRLVDSKPLNALASSLNYVPFSGRSATEDAMNSQLNRALSRTFGQNDSNVTMALRKAEGALGGQFDTFLKSNSVNVDQQFMNDLADAGTQATKELGTDQAGIINNQINEILQKGANGQIDGQTAYNIKKTLDRIGNRNSPEAWYALDLKGKLMDALNRSVGPQQAQAFQSLRQQYGNMLSLQKLAKNGVEGEVSAARLANLQNINNPDVQELADIAAQFVKPREGAHGAAQRVYGAGGHLGGLGGIAAVGGYLGGPIGAALGTAGTVATGRGLNGLLNSQAVRSLVLNPAPAAGTQPLGLMANGAYRALPLAPGLLQSQ